jgi:hypothetical protein
LEGEVWIGFALATESRLMISFRIAASEAALAEPLIAETEARLALGQSPLWVSDGLDAYGSALFKRHHRVDTFPRTGKRGRPRRPKLVACPGLRYGQFVKLRDDKHHLVGFEKRAVYGDIPLSEVRTVCIERQNLNERHENRRLTRKTCAFSKKANWLARQLNFHQAYHNLVRLHRGLTLKTKVGQKIKRTPAQACGLTDHCWSLRELMCCKSYINH